MESKLRLSPDQLTVSSFETADSATAVALTTGAVVSAINLCTGSGCTLDYVCLQLTLLAEDCFGPTLPAPDCGAVVE